jgi:hypothetical protein
MFTAEHEAFWSAARRAHGDGDGTRELVEVLLLHRHLPDRDVIEGLAAATAVGAVRADVVAVEARRIADTRPRTPDIDHIPNDPVGSSRVVSLTQRRLSDPAAVIAGLPLDQRPLPTVNAYDELLGRRKTTAPQAEQRERGKPWEVALSWGSLPEFRAVMLIRIRCSTSNSPALGSQTNRARSFASHGLPRSRAHHRFRRRTPRPGSRPPRGLPGSRCSRGGHAAGR